MTAPTPVTLAAGPLAPARHGASLAQRRTEELSTIARLRDFMPHDAVASWVATLLVTALAFAIRVVDLGRPNYLVFDETYYAKDAYSLLKVGYEQNWPDAKIANPSVAAGNPNIMESAAEFVVHPPLGKWLIGLGELAFGMNSFGWRIAACVFGSLLVLLTIRLARRLSRSTLVGVMAGLLLTFDGLAFTMSRIALLDIFQATFLVAGVASLLVDRDQHRNALADKLTGLGVPDFGGRFGALHWWRPWRLIAGLMFGAACAVKWNSVYVVAVFGLLTVAWDIGARRLAGSGTTAWAAAGIEGVPAFFALVGTALIVYVASWWGWFASAGGWDRQWGANNLDNPLVKTLGTDLASWVWYHKEIYDFHTGDFINKATHPYAANPWGWLLMLRPIGIDAVNDIKPGHDGCDVVGTTCLRVISGMGTPLLWWAAAAALVVVVLRWIVVRDWRFGVVALAVASTWLPWCLSSLTQTRPLFFFYAILIVPFTATGLAMVLGLILGRRQQRRRRMIGAVIAGLVVASVMANFAYLYPVLTDALMPYGEWIKRMWLSSWI